MDYAYTYDGAGNRTSEAIEGATPRYFHYNSLGQLYEEIEGQRTTSYSFDVYGNLSLQKTTDAGVETDASRYAWDTENHLVEVRRYDRGTLIAIVAYAYDEEGMRISSRLNSAPSVRFFTDYANPTGYSQTIAELDESGTQVSEKYTYGSDLLAQCGTMASPAGGAQQLAFFHGDNLGSTRLLTKGSDGTSVADSTFNYAPYGTLLNEPQAPPTSYRFTGQSYDSNTGLQYHRARWLNTGTANWLSSDPVFDFPENYGSQYAYCGLAPTNASDPTGAFSLVETANIAGIVSLLAQGALSATGKMQDALGVQLISDSQMSAIRNVLLIVDLVCLPFNIYAGIKCVSGLLARPNGMAQLGKLYASVFGKGGLCARAFVKGVSQLSKLKFVPEIPANVPTHLHGAILLVQGLTEEARALIATKNWALLRQLYGQIPNVNKFLRTVTNNTKTEVEILRDAGSAIDGIVKYEVGVARMRIPAFGSVLVNTGKRLANLYPDIMLEGGVVLDMTSASQAPKAMKYLDVGAEAAIDILYEPLKGVIP